MFPPTYSTSSDSTPDAASAPFFTVAVACFNLAPYLGECLSSILSQSFGDWECIAWVEESDDGTEAIARDFAARDPRIHVFTGPRTGSASLARNKGIELARGEYILFADGDDWFSPNAFQQLHDRIAEHPGADMYMGAGRKFRHSSGETVQILDNYPESLVRELTGAEATFLQTDRWPLPMLQLAVFLRAFLLRTGLECIPGLPCEDAEFYPRAIYLAQRVIPLHLRYYQYRLRDNSIMTARKNRIDFFYDRHVITYRSLLAFYGVVSQESGFDRRVAGFWAKAWIGRQIAQEWFRPEAQASVSRKRRADTLQALFADGFAAFDRLRCAGGVKTRVIGWWIKLFVLHPRLRGCADLFFRAYEGLNRLKSRL